MKIIDTLHVAREFSRYPAGRYRSDGPHSGERFRDDFLHPRLLEAREEHVTLCVVFDETMGAPSGFLEEAFGGLVRVRGWRVNELHDLLSVEDSLKIQRFMEDADLARFRSDIKRLCEIAHITEIANHFEVSESTVNRWLAGTSAPMPGIRVMVAKMLDTLHARVTLAETTPSTAVLAD